MSAAAAEVQRELEAALAREEALLRVLAGVRAGAGALCGGCRGGFQRRVHALEDRHLAPLYAQEDEDAGYDEGPDTFSKDRNLKNSGGESFGAETKSVFSRLGERTEKKGRPVMKKNNPLNVALKAVAESRAAEGFASSKMIDSNAGLRVESGTNGNSREVVKERWEREDGGERGERGAGGERYAREERMEKVDREEREDREREREREREEGEREEQIRRKNETLRKERERMAMVVRETNLVCYERVRGQNVNILEGIELHKNVFSETEQKRLVDFVLEMEEKGRRNELLERTFSSPKKWMKGKGRVTIQFGCCYNYIADKDGAPPGIHPLARVEALPALLKRAIRRLVRWRVLPPAAAPDSCIVNIYDQGDCIPPHIDHHDFLRPFCTLSLLSAAPIVFGASLASLSPGVFAGAYQMLLPPGSVLVINGNGADVAKHAIPAVPQKRISITFRKMDPQKQPVFHVPDPEILSERPLNLHPTNEQLTPGQSNAVNENDASALSVLAKEFVPEITSAKSESGKVENLSPVSVQSLIPLYVTPPPSLTLNGKHIESSRGSTYSRWADEEDSVQGSDIE